MKKFKYIKTLTIALITTSLSSCNFLEVDPIGKTTIPVFFSDMDGVRAAMPGAYSTVYDYYSSEFYKYPDVAGNMLSLNGVGTGSEMANQYNFTSSAEQETEAVGYIWRKILVAMANANNIIEYQPALIEKFPTYRVELERIKAEALFIRALCHFDLCRTYAQPFNYTADASHIGVPVLLKTPGPNVNIGRSTTKEVYYQIEKDLRESIISFGETPLRDAFHASKKSSQALLSRAFLYMEKWDSVIKYSSIVIANTPLSRGDNYTGMYNKMMAGDEAIFRLSGIKKSSSLSKFYSFLSPIYTPADTLVKLFDPSDIRLKLLVNAESKPMCLKYYITENVAEIDKHYDPFVLRVSEMYLNRAEAYLNKNQLSLAAADVKEIIARGLGKSVAEVSINETDKAILEKIIEKERAKELCFEGHQFFDITRKKKDLVREKTTNSTVKKLPYPNYLFVLPIPQAELNANPNMKPNPMAN